ncbi:hypothetical protein J5N97_013639 [Dioscorea zingiberensis]|uniref:Uncharacterized protein n=1 Tax=Dioscorea zingiberensis TaxID=325984 RepID=A0A9D5HIU2_9LILI|nr:hypothetical protein J5N97_013639 [Dioscorea zingiberensis]
MEKRFGVEVDRACLEDEELATNVEEDAEAVEDEMQLRIEGLQFAEDGILIQSSLKALEVLSRSCIKPKSVPCGFSARQSSSSKLIILSDKVQLIWMFLLQRGQMLHMLQ